MLQDYAKVGLDELSLRRSERVEVISDSGTRWLVKNRIGEQGYAPVQVLEGAYVRGKYNN